MLASGLVRAVVCLSDAKFAVIRRRALRTKRRGGFTLRAYEPVAVAFTVFDSRCSAFGTLLNVGAKIVRYLQDSHVF